jgi:integrase/recombinase XerD
VAGGWSARARMSGPLVEYAVGFEAELGRLGYAPGSVAHQLRLMAQLDGWLAGRGLEAAALSLALVEEFMAPRRVAGVHLHSAAALRPLLVYLCRLGFVPAAPAVGAADTVVERLLERYHRYLIVERGLAASTARGYACEVRPFLAARAGGHGLDLDGLRAGDVTAFIVGRCRQRRGRELVTALRSLLGFLHVEGLVGGGLVTAVPSVASWTLAGVPQVLEPGQVRRLLASCDRGTVAGPRDFAILTVLARLGLRAGEAAARRLDDIDWRAGEIAVRNGKRGRRETLPLPVDVGEALADYLRHARPANADTRCVFVRVLAPSRGLTSSGVADVVAAACRRCGLGRIGAHRLRHTAATETLRAGAPLAEVGQLLRHRLPRTTAIYAKVNREALRGLARPWPGGRS